VLESCRAAIRLVEPTCRVATYPTQDRSVRVVANGGRSPEAFPEHGPRREHDRSIMLEPWHRKSVALLDAFVGPKR
jgi:hypothetical protein